MSLTNKNSQFQADEFLAQRCFESLKSKIILSLLRKYGWLSNNYQDL